MTDAEKKLWDVLRDCQWKGLKVRRQVPIRWFIVDFLCVKYNLVIEIDGGIHNRQCEYDAEREELLREKGYRIIRFTNDEVMDSFGSVLNHIAAETIHRQTHTEHSLLPAGSPFVDGILKP